MKLEIEIPEGKKAEWVDGVLTLVDEKPKDITERIKTFEDAMTWCGKNGKNYLCEEYCTAMDVGLFECASDIAAYLKLRIITCALNEGWKPTFEEEEERWEPFMELGRVKAILSCGGNMWNYPTRLSFKSQELAVYAAEQFRDIYMDFCHKGKE